MTAPVRQTVTQTAAPLTGGQGAAFAATSMRGAPEDFLSANRIHVQDGSLFIDPYLVVHPRELAPQNETALRNKLRLTYSVNNPSFFENRARMAMALNLGQLIPVSPSAKRSQLLEEIERFNKQAEAGKDVDLERDIQRRLAPFSSIVQQILHAPASDPVGLETLKNSLGIYMLVREKMTQQGYLKSLTEYLPRTNNADQILAELARKTGLNPLAFRNAAAKDGLDGVGALLGLDPRYVAEVKGLCEYAAANDFSHNIVEHWHLGRQLRGIASPFQEKLNIGLEARITAKISELRDQTRHQFEVPAPVKKQEESVVESLKLLEPEQRALMYKLGYEICYTPEVYADKIAFYPNIYGLHRKAANDMRDARATYRIYFSGHGDLRAAQRTFVHETAHALWPDQFSPEEALKIDLLAKGDQNRFTLLQHLMDNQFPQFETLFNSYKAAGTEPQRSAVVAQANQYFSAYGLDMQGLFPYLRDAHDFKYAVRHVYDTLSIEGDRYTRSNYNSPEERFREVLSRFAELKQVEYRGEPQFLQFLAPGLNQVWENHYLPHISRVVQGLENGSIKPLYEPAKADGVATAPAVAHIPAGDSATHAHGADTTATTTIDAGTVELNSRVVSALNALDTMGIRSRS